MRKPTMMSDASQTKHVNSNGQRRLRQRSNDDERTERVMGRKMMPPRGQERDSGAPRVVSEPRGVRHDMRPPDRAILSGRNIFHAAAVRWVTHQLGHTLCVIITTDTGQSVFSATLPLGPWFTLSRAVLSSSHSARTCP